MIDDLFENKMIELTYVFGNAIFMFKDLKPLYPSQPDFVILVGKRKKDLLIQNQFDEAFWIYNQNKTNSQVIRYFANSSFNFCQTIDRLNLKNSMSLVDIALTNVRNSENIPIINADECLEIKLEGVYFEEYADVIKKLMNLYSK
jgi:hypothetical protein